MSNPSTHNKTWLIAILTSCIMSFSTTICTYLSLVALSLHLGVLGTLCSWVATIGIVGFSVGMLATGNAHAGGSMTVVLTVATLVNFILFTGFIYMLLQAVR